MKNFLKNNIITIILVALILGLAGFLGYKYFAKPKAPEKIEMSEDSIFVQQLAVHLDLLREIVEQMGEIEKAGNDYQSDVEIDLSKPLEAKQMERFFKDFESFYDKHAKDNRKFATQQEFFNVFMAEKKWKEADLVFVMQKLVGLFSTINIASLKASIVPELIENRTSLADSDLEAKDKDLLNSKIDGILAVLDKMGNAEVSEAEAALVNTNNERIRKLFVNLQNLFEAE